MTTSRSCGLFLLGTTTASDGRCLLIRVLRKARNKSQRLEAFRHGKNATEELLALAYPVISRPEQEPNGCTPNRQAGGEARKPLLHHHRAGCTSDADEYEIVPISGKVDTRLPSGQGQNQQRSTQGCNAVRKYCSL